MKILPLIVFLTIAPLIYSRAQSPSGTLSPAKIIKLIPNKIKEFHLNGDPHSKEMKMGTLRYSMAEKNFSANNKRSIKILLFDYKEAPIMYNQATRKWNAFATIESDSIIHRPAVVENCTGWESYNVIRKNSQIILGIYDRFFLTIEGTNVDLESLRTVVQGFKFETFPK